MCVCVCTHIYIVTCPKYRSGGLGMMRSVFTIGRTAVMFDLWPFWRSADRRGFPIVAVGTRLDPDQECRSLLHVPTPARMLSCRSPSSAPRRLPPADTVGQWGLDTPGQAQAAENPTAPPAASGDWGSIWGRDDRRRQKGDRYVLLLTTRWKCRSLSSWSRWCSKRKLSVGGRQQGREADYPVPKNGWWTRSCPMLRARSTCSQSGIR